MYTVTLLSTLADLDAALKAMPTTRYYDFATPATRPAWDRQRTVSRLRRCNRLWPVACRALMHVQCHPSGTAPFKFWSLMPPFVWGRPTTILNNVIYSSFHTVVEVQFGGLARLDRAANNYKDNLNSLYRHPDLTLTIDKALRNIIVSAYSHYIDSWPMNGACVGHRAILMRSMLQFAMHYSRYRRRQ